jgi:hypothetical protein
MNTGKVLVMTLLAATVAATTAVSAQNTTPSAPGRVLNAPPANNDQGTPSSSNEGTTDGKTPKKKKHHKHTNTPAPGGNSVNQTSEGASTPKQTSVPK